LHAKDGTASYRGGALSTGRNLIRERDDELANDIERLARLQSEFMGVSSAKPQ
jgi:hypothetical protein